MDELSLNKVVRWATAGTTTPTGSSYPGTCRPQQPTAFMMEALWMTRYGMPAFTALSTRSLCVVALQHNNNLQLDTSAKGSGLST